MQRGSSHSGTLSAASSSQVSLLHPSSKPANPLPSAPDAVKRRPKQPAPSTAAPGVPRSRSKAPSSSAPASAARKPPAPSSEAVKTEARGRGGMVKTVGTATRQAVVGDAKAGTKASVLVPSSRKSEGRDERKFSPAASGSTNTVKRTTTTTTTTTAAAAEVLDACASAAVAPAAAKRPVATAMEAISRQDAPLNATLAKQTVLTSHMPAIASPPPPSSPTPALALKTPAPPHPLTPAQSSTAPSPLPETLNIPYSSTETSEQPQNLSPTPPPRSSSCPNSDPSLTFAPVTPRRTSSLLWQEDQEALAKLLTERPSTQSPSPRTVIQEESKPSPQPVVTTIDPIHVPHHSTNTANLSSHLPPPSSSKPLQAPPRVGSKILVQEPTATDTPPPLSSTPHSFSTPNTTQIQTPRPPRPDQPPSSQDRPLPQRLTNQIDPSLLPVGSLTLRGRRVVPLGDGGKKGLDSPVSSGRLKVSEAIRVFEGRMEGEPFVGKERGRVAALARKFGGSVGGGDGKDEVGKRGVGRIEKGEVSGSRDSAVVMSRMEVEDLGLRVKDVVDQQVDGKAGLSVALGRCKDDGLVGSKDILVKEIDSRTDEALVPGSVVKDYAGVAPSSDATTSDTQNDKVSSVETKVAPLPPPKEEAPRKDAWPITRSQEGPLTAEDDLTPKTPRQHKDTSAARKEERPAPLPKDESPMERSAQMLMPRNDEVPPSVFRGEDEIGTISLPLITSSVFSLDGVRRDRPFSVLDPAPPPSLTSKPTHSIVEDSFPVSLSPPKNFSLALQPSPASTPSPSPPRRPLPEPPIQAPLPMTITDRVLQELLTTERTYIQELDTYLALYVLPMSSASRTLLDDQFLQRLFLNIQEVEELGRGILLPGIEVAVACQGDGMSVCGGTDDEAEVFTGSQWWKRWWVGKVPELRKVFGMNDDVSTLKPDEPLTHPVNEDWNQFAEFRDIVEKFGKEDSEAIPVEPDHTSHPVSALKVSESIEDWWDREAHRDWDKTNPQPSSLHAPPPPQHLVDDNDEDAVIKREGSIRSIGSTQPPSQPGGGGSILSRFIKARPRRRSLSVGAAGVTGEASVGATKADDQGLRGRKGLLDEEEGGEGRRRSWSRGAVGKHSGASGVDNALIGIGEGKSTSVLMRPRHHHRLSVTSSISSATSSVSSLLHPAESDDDSIKQLRSTLPSHRGRGANLNQKHSHHGTGSAASSRSSSALPVSMQLAQNQPKVKPVTAVAALFLWLLETGVFECYEYYVPRMSGAQKLATEMVVLSNIPSSSASSTVSSTTSTPSFISIPRSTSSSPSLISHGRPMSTQSLVSSSVGSLSSHLQIAQNILGITLGRKKEVVAPAPPPEMVMFGADWRPSAGALEAGSAFLRAARGDPRHGQLGILGYLVLPFQRLTRLLTTLPADDEESIDLVSLLTQRLRKTVESCNEAAKLKTHSYTIKRRALASPPAESNPYHRSLPPIPPPRNDDPDRTPRKPMKVSTDVFHPVETGPESISPSLSVLMGLTGYPSTDPVDRNDALSISESLASSIESGITPSSSAAGAGSRRSSLHSDVSASLLKDGLLTLISDRTHDTALQSAESWNSGTTSPIDASTCASSKTALVALYSDGRFVLYPLSGDDGTLQPCTVLRVLPGGAALVAGVYGGVAVGGRKRRVRVVGAFRPSVGIFEDEVGGSRVFPKLFPKGRMRGRKKRKEEFREVVVEGDEEEIVGWWKAINML
ncbi:hypothetical protein HDU67_008604 [Dinochytrium kinnereticum]|nr:hypothetical protein HDU67_008604 [Dinochytrium kinnereticum]